MELRFHLDENVNHAIALGLRRRGADVRTTSEAGLIGVSDEQQLSAATSDERVLVTHDDDYLRLHDHGIEHAGIAYCHQRNRTIGQIILALISMWRTRSAEEMRNRIEFL